MGVGFFEKRGFLNLARNFAFGHFLSGWSLFVLGIFLGLPGFLLILVSVFFYGGAFWFSRKEWRSFSWNAFWDGLSALPRWPLMIAALFWILDLLFCLLPPGEHIEADGLIYHLAIPWQYYLRGGVVPLDWSVNEKFPLYLQMAQLPFTVLSFPWVVKIWQIAAHTGLLAVIWSWAAALGCLPRQRIWILAFFSALALFAKQYGTAMFDWANLLYTLLGFFYLSEGVRRQKRGAIFWGALFLGIAASAKTFYIFLPFVWFLSFWTTQIFSRTWKPLRKNIAISILPFFSALLWMLPVYSRNFFLVGNPFFPLFLDWLGPVMDNRVAYEVANHIRLGIYGYGYSFFDFILMPLRMVLPNTRFDYWTDPLLLVFLAAALFQAGRFWREGRRLILCIAGFLYFFLFLGSQQARFFYPFWVLVILTGGKWLTEKVKPSLLSVVLGLQAIVCAGLLLFFHRDALAALKRGLLDGYLDRVSFSRLWQRSVPENTPSLCLRPLAQTSLKDFFYFTVPVTVVEHPTSVYSLARSKEKVFCDRYMVGSQFPPESIFLSEGKGRLVSREIFWDRSF